MILRIMASCANIADIENLISGLSAEKVAVPAKGHTATNNTYHGNKNCNEPANVNLADAGFQFYFAPVMTDFLGEY